MRVTSACSAADTYRPRPQDTQLIAYHYLNVRGVPLLDVFVRQTGQRSRVGLGHRRTSEPATQLLQQRQQPLNAVFDRCFDQPIFIH